MTGSTSKISSQETAIDSNKEKNHNERDAQIVFSFCFLVSLVSACHNLVMPFLAPSQQFHCLDNPVSNLELNGPNRPNNISTKIGNCFINTPDVAGNNITETPNATVPCESWKFDDSFYKRTIVSEWKLVCDNEWLISLSQSVFMGGYVSAMVVFGYLSDQYGRRPTIWISFSIFISAGLLGLLSPGYTVFTVFRFFVSMGITGAGTTSFILLMELLEPKRRSRYGIGIQFGWSVGFVLLPALAWISRDWFNLQIMTTVPASLLLIYWWLIPESLRWNCRTDRVDINLESEDKERENKSTFLTLRRKPKFLDLFRTPNMRKKSIVLFICWFVNSFIYFGLSLGAGNLGGNSFINFFIAGAIEFPAHVAATHLIRIIGRRIPLMMALIVGGIACLLTIPLMNSDHLLWLRIFLAMTGKFFITMSFSILYVFSAELFPTMVRTMGVGSCSLFARIASMIAPFVKELSEITHPNVPFAVFGSMSVISGLIVLLLPETRMVVLPDTIEEVEESQL